MCFNENLQGSISGTAHQRFVRLGTLRSSRPGCVSVCLFALRSGDLSRPFPWIRAMTVNYGSYKCLDG